MDVSEINLIFSWIKAIHFRQESIGIYFANRLQIGEFEFMTFLNYIGMVLSIIVNL